MAGTLKKDAPINYTDDAVIVSPLDWNLLKDIVLKMKSDINVLKSENQNFKNSIIDFEQRISDLESP